MQQLCALCELNFTRPSGGAGAPDDETELKLTPDQIEAYCQDISAKAPLGRVGEGEGDGIAKAVSFLASDGASYAPGAEWFVSGGLVQV